MIYYYDLAKFEANYRLLQTCSQKFRAVVYFSHKYPPFDSIPQTRQDNEQR